MSISRAAHAMQKLSATLSSKMSGGFAQTCRAKSTAAFFSFASVAAERQGAFAAPVVGAQLEQRHVGRQKLQQGAVNHQRDV
jgi:hypothetical protein